MELKKLHEFLRRRKCSIIIEFHIDEGNVALRHKTSSELADDVRGTMDESKVALQEVTYIEKGDDLTSSIQVKGHSAQSSNAGHWTKAM